MSAKQKIEDALKATPNISIDGLQKQLPEVKPITLKSNFYKLRRKLFSSDTVRHEAQSNLAGESPASKMLTRHIEYRVLGGYQVTVLVKRRQRACRPEAERLK